MRRVVKSVGAGIGLATEAYAARKSSSASHTAAGLQSTTTDVPSAGQHDGEHEEHLPRPEIDEAGWDLDDAVDEQEGAEAEENETGKTTMSVDHLASPVFTVINVAANVVGNVPSVAAIVTSISVMVVVGVAKEMQSRTRSNSFLDQLNEKFFQSRGLYCIIMTYKPDSTSAHETVDISKTIQSKIDPSGSGWHEKMNKIKASSGKTHEELEMPLAAPLIYPGLDAAANASSDEQQKQNALKESQKFVADYYGRRAQATYAAENMESSLSVPQSTDFASRYSDANHAANNCSLISLITGGSINPQTRRDEKRNRLSDRRGNRQGLINSMIRPTSATKGGKRESPVWRLLKKDVLYLMIVNMPAEEELNTAKEMLAQPANPI
ncbi:hypothetical protein MMC34_001466 [Xylographa carneopallida]|nr:hypothetical protein [Xylographa carneopallida]